MVGDALAKPRKQTGKKNNILRRKRPSMDAATSNRAYDNHEKHVKFMIFVLSDNFFSKVLGETKIDERKNDIVCRYIEE